MTGCEFPVISPFLARNRFLNGDQSEEGLVPTSRTISCTITASRMGQVVSGRLPSTPMSKYGRSHSSSAKALKSQHPLRMGSDFKVIISTMQRVQWVGIRKRPEYHTCTQPMLISVRTSWKFNIEPLSVEGILARAGASRRNTFIFFTLRFDVTTGPPKVRRKISNRLIKQVCDSRHNTMNIISSPVQLNPHERIHFVNPEWLPLPPELKLRRNFGTNDYPRAKSNDDRGTLQRRTVCSHSFENSSGVSWRARDL